MLSGHFPGAEFLFVPIFSLKKGTNFTWCGPHPFGFLIIFTRETLQGFEERNSRIKKYINVEGLRQGNPLTPLLFNLIVEAIDTHTSTTIFIKSNLLGFADYVDIIDIHKEVVKENLVEFEKGVSNLKVSD